MKKIFKTFVPIICLVGFLSSCDDELDQLPNDSVTPQTFYTNNADFESATRGIYSGFLGGAYYGGLFSSLADIMTDNVIIAPAGRLSNQVFFEWRQAPNLAWNVMGSPYLITNRANLIIQNIDNLSDGQDKNNFLGEARATRALALFDMLRVYSKIPTQSADASSSLGMPIITVTDPNIEIPRPTVEESYNFVISEFEAAKSLLNSDNGSGRLNTNSVNALLSRVYLYNGDYQASIDAANDVSGSVASITSFPGIWTDANTDGVLFKIDQDRILDGVGIGVQWSQSNAGNVIPEYVASFELFNLYQNTDIRKTSYMSTLPDAAGNIYNAITKIFGETGQNNGVVDAKVIRMSEVYLNKAEAYSNLNNDAMALASLDEVRSNRISGFVSGNETGTALMDAIRLERRLEFFAESHRFFDLKRWNEGVVRSATDGEFFDGTGTTTATNFLSLPAGSNLYQLPIPQAERNIFPGLQQNPGY